MNILQLLQRFRDDVKAWVTINLKALDKKIDDKTFPIDTKLSSTSKNPVQNKVINAELDDLKSKVGNTTVANQISAAIAKHPHFSGDYNDLVNAPNIIEDESGDLAITDDNGNIIFKVDAEGVHSTALTLDGKPAASEEYVDKAIATKVDFTGYATEKHVEQSIETVKTELSEFIVSESNEWKIVDNEGNIIFSVDAEGAHTTTLTLNGENAATETYVDNRVADLVNSAPELLDTLGELATAIESHEDAYDALLETIGSKATYEDLENLETEIGESIISETDEFHIVDDAGNIMVSIDENGLTTTTVTASSIIVNGDTVENHMDNTTIHVTADEKKYWNEKVDSVEGKGLSTNDFDNSYKSVIDNLGDWAKEPTKPSYTAEEVNALAGDTVLADLATDADHRTVTDAEKQVWNAKSDFSGNYSDLVNAPNITDDDSGDLVIADPEGNIIFRSDSDGFETTKVVCEELVVNGVKVNPDSMIGTWVFYDEITITPKYTGINIVFMWDGVKYTKIVDEGDGVYYYDENGEAWSVYYYNGEWESSSYRTIQILEEPSAEVAACIKANAKRYKPIGVDKIATIYTDFWGAENFDTDGAISWTEGFAFYDDNDNEIKQGRLYQRLPIIAGKNVSFEYDEENNAIAINATDGGSSTTDSMVGTWIFNDEITLPTEDLLFNFSNNRPDEHGVLTTYQFYCIKASAPVISYYGHDIDFEDVYEIPYGWSEEGYKTIEILEEPATKVVEWLSANASKQEADYITKAELDVVLAANKPTHFSFASGSTSYVESSDAGIYWSNNETEIEYNGGNDLYYATSSNCVPIVAGDNITFTVDEDNCIVKINAISGSSTNDSMIGTWVFNDTPSFDEAVFNVPCYFEYTVADQTCNSISLLDNNYGLAAYFISYGQESASITAYASEPVVWLTGGWDKDEYKTLVINSEPQDEWIKAWIRANASKLEETSEQVLQTAITYNELKALRDNSELVPGMFYRITDYQCTTTQVDTRAMEHRFDIIVQALDVDVLSEDASAIWHKGDEYFSEHNLVAWELKYAIDNDTSRFIWADRENGKGVIYYMKDDLDNECPYDFKNIQFKRYKVTECEVASLVGEYVGVEGYDELVPPSEIQYDSTDFIWCYTFTLLLDNGILDVSTSKEYQLAERNEIKKYSLYYGYGDNLLNNNIFILPRWHEDDYFSIRDNKVEGAYNTLDASYSIDNNLINGYCNIFVSSDVYDNTVRGSENIFGGVVHSSTIQGTRNFFFGNIASVTTGWHCRNNRFGEINFSSLGNDCHHIMFCSSDLTPASYITNLHIADNCGYLKLINDELGNRNSYVRGVTIPPDIKGTASVYKELQVARNAAPVIFEAANTTHIILD